MLFRSGWAIHGDDGLEIPIGGVAVSAGGPWMKREWWRWKCVFVVFVGEVARLQVWRAAGGERREQ